ncbi:hypothetical protein Tco_0866500 [Tanacetum coccineum]
MTIKLPVGNNVVPLRSDTIRLVQNGCSFHGLRSEDPNQHLKDFLKLVDSLDLNGENRERTRLTVKLRKDILMFQQHHRESLSEAWTRFKDLLRKVPHHGIDLWLQVQIFYDRIDHTLKRTVDYAAGGRLRKMRVMECKVDTVMKEAISLMGRSESIFGMTSNTVYQLPSEPSRQEEFEDLVMNFILDQEEKVKQLKEYMGVIGNDFMQLSSEVIVKLKEEIRMEEIRVKKIEKITRYPDTEDLEPLNGHKFSEALTEKAAFHTPKFVLPKTLCVKHVRTVFPSPTLERESTFGFKPSIKNNRNVKSRYDTENLSPQSTPQVLASFKEYTLPVTYPEEVEETLGTPMEVEPLNKTQLEDLGLNTCNHDIPFSSREVPSFDEPKP